MKKLWYIMIFYSHIESYEHLHRNHMTYRKGKCFLRHYIEVAEPCFIWFVIWNNKLSNLKELKSFLGFWYNFLHHIFFKTRTCVILTKSTTSFEHILSICLIRFILVSRYGGNLLLINTDARFFQHCFYSYF